jgi:hypothetical protein
MIKKIIFLLLTGMVFYSCTKNQQVKVTYETTGAISAYNLYYQEGDGTLKQTTVEPQSAQDKWTYSFTGEQGDIVYVSGNYKDPNSALKMLIKVDGKIYKQGSNEGDTIRFLTVSGVVPFD